MADRRDWPTSITVQLPAFTEACMADFEANGITFMELTGGNVGAFESYASRAAGIFKTAGAHGVKIRSVHLPFSPGALVDPAALDRAVRASFLKIQTELLKISAAAGAEIAIIHPSLEPYAEENRPEHLKCAIDSLGNLNEVAKAEGVRLAVENLPRTCMGRDCFDLARIGEEIPDAYFCFDANHSLRDSNADIIKTMGSRIVATHISDYDFVDERHLFPGEGKVCWQEIMACLEEIGYTGTWNYEIKSGDEIPASIFTENRQKLISGEIL